MPQEKDLTRKMSEASDQKVPDKAPGKPALGENIKDIDEAELKRKTAQQMPKTQPR